MLAIWFKSQDLCHRHYRRGWVEEGIKMPPKTKMKDGKVASYYFPEKLTEKLTILGSALGKNKSELARDMLESIPVRIMLFFIDLYLTIRDKSRATKSRR